jgi:hypothetical protein
LDSRAMAGHLFIWRRSVFSQPHGGIDFQLLSGCFSPELLRSLWKLFALLRLVL